MKVLSLFDGMACGAIAFKELDIPIERYVAYEIDKYAIKAATHNFPFIEERGDVFDADFTEFEGFDWLIGGSPCTYWSIAQKNNRETEASGMGWELFQQYVRALHEAKPKYFLYENNKSMSKAIRKSITETFGFEPICINSALVSAQNRQRLYWVGIRQNDGTYRQADIEQPEDRGILLKDILQDGCVEKKKAYCLKHQAGNARDYFKKHHTNIKFEPCIVAQRGRNPENPSSRAAGEYLEQRYEAKTDGKSNVLTRVSKDNMIAEPVNVTDDGKSQTIKAQYQQTSPRNICCYTSTYGASGVAEPVCMRYERDEIAKALRKDYEAGTVKHGFHEHSELHPREDGKTNTVSTVGKDNPICEPVRIGTFPRQNGEVSESKQFRIYSENGKSTTLCGNGGGLGAKTGLYAIPIEFDGDIPTKAISCADGKTYTVYEVKDGQITIKDKQYPIKLIDGYYIIRKLTVLECMRLQTVPEWYQFKDVISDSQAYKCLGNGWTVQVIMHLLKGAMNNVNNN